MILGRNFRITVRVELNFASLLRNRREIARIQSEYRTAQKKMGQHAWLGFHVFTLQGQQEIHPDRVHSSVQTTMRLYIFRRTFRTLQLEKTYSNRRLDWNPGSHWGREVTGKSLGSELHFPLTALQPLRHHAVHALGGAGQLRRDVDPSQGSLHTR